MPRCAARHGSDVGSGSSCRAAAHRLAGAHMGRMFSGDVAMLTRRTFTGLAGSAICAVTDVVGPGAQAQGSPPARTTARNAADQLTVDPRIRRVLRTRSVQERLDLDVLRGRVTVQSQAGRSSDTVTKPVLVEFTTDSVPQG